MTMTDTKSQPETTPTVGQVPLDGVAAGSNWPDAELAAFVECILLVATEPPAITDLAAAAGVEPGRIEAALALLQQASDRGWVIQRHGDQIQLGTAPRFADYVRRFLGLDRESKLSAASMEALAIIAYQQPTTRAELEAIRGVDCSGVLATLHARGLIEIVGRRATIGNPNEYGTSPQFLRHFGLGSLTDLPDLGTVEDQDVGARLDELAATAETGAPESPT